MVDLARKLCDDLLGPDRNKPPFLERSKQIRFTDKDVCKCFLVAFCPHDLFTNTKSDIGVCPFKYHEDSLRDQYKLEGDKFREEYELEFMEFLQKLISDLDKKAKRGSSRLDVQATNIDQKLKDETEEKIILLELEMKELIAKMEACGEEGRVAEAEELNLHVDRLRFEIERLRHMDFTVGSKPIAGGALLGSGIVEKQMELCDICGALLVVNDTQKRLEAHNEGKQHQGFMKVRAALKELIQKYPDYIFKGSSIRRETALSKTPVLGLRKNRSPSPVRFERRNYDRNHPSRPPPRDRDYGRKPEYGNVSGSGHRYNDRDSPASFSSRDSSYSRNRRY